MKSKKPFLNFQVDHMTLLLQPELYQVAYIAFHVIFGLRPDDVIYDVKTDDKKQSMTYALRLGEGAHSDSNLNRTIIAVVQPTELKTQPSHVRDMLDDHNAAAHWQHIALRTPDLLAFYKHALERGVQFVTPILKDAKEDLIQVFSGEWYFPGTKPSGMFFEFVQRNPSEQDMQEIEKQNREFWFRDKTFLGLYKEKQLEYDSGEIMPFLSFELFNLLLDEFRDKQIWQITESDLERAEDMMIQHRLKSSKM